MHSPVAFLCALATILFWAGSFPAITLALDGFAPLPLAALRFAIATATLCVLLGAAIALERMAAPRVEKRDLLWFVVCGALGIAVYNALLNTGQRTVSPAAASFLIACQPVFAAIAGRAKGERGLSRAGWIGTAVCLIGAGILSAGQPGGIALGAGAPLVALAAVCSGTSFALQRPLVERYGPLASAFGLLAAGAVLLSPWIGQGVTQTAKAPSSAIVALVFLGVLPGALAYVTWMVALRELGSALAANLLFFMAPTAALLAIPLTGAWPHWTTWVGGAVALVGVAVVHRSGRQESPRRSSDNRLARTSQQRSRNAKSP